MSGPLTVADCRCGCALTKDERAVVDAGLRKDFGLHYAVARIADSRAAAALARFPVTMACPTCRYKVRETAGLVCQTCGTDYGAPGVVIQPLSGAWARGRAEERAELLAKVEGLAERFENVGVTVWDRPTLIEAAHHLRALVADLGGDDE